MSAAQSVEETRTVQPERREGTSRAMRESFSGPVASMIVIFITVLWTMPIIGLFITSLRPAGDVANTGWWTVILHPSTAHFTLSNYSEVMFSSAGAGTSGGLAPYFINSFAISIPATLIPLAIASMAAYALAWMNFRGATALFFAVFALQVVPLQMALIPLLQIYSRTGIAGTFAPVWISHVMFSLPLAIFLLHNFMSQLPRELMEAASVDGANHFVVFRKIVLPLSVPAIASFAIFQFLWVWNDLLVALTFAGGTPQVAPLTARLSQLSGSLGSRLNLLTAGAFIAIVVPLIVFFALQRYFVRGLLAGSVKG